MTRTILMLAPLALLALCLTQGTGEACVHPNDDFEHYVDSGSQRGLILWDNGREELVLQPGFRVAALDLKDDEFTEEGMLADFTSFAWLVPLPALPDSYAEIEPEIFDDIAEFTEIESRVPEASDNRDTGPIVDTGEGALEFYEPAEVGEYEIQPVKANGEKGQEELVEWFKDNDFGELDERIVRYYTKVAYYWLAIKFEAEDGLPRDGNVKPLHISFKSDKPVYPLKAYDKRGGFGLDLWLITRHEVDLTKSKRFGIFTPEQKSETRRQKNREVAWLKLPETVKALAEGKEELKEMRTGKVFVYRFEGRNIEVEGGFDLDTLQDDVHFRFIKDAAPKPETDVEPLPEEGEDGEPGDGEQPEEEGMD